MIFVFGGTIDARIIAERLLQEGIPATVQTLTEYGATLVGEHANFGALNSENIEETIKNSWAVVDATHPFATNISHLAMQAAANLKKPYLRFERPHATPTASHIQHAHNHEAAASLACSFVSQGSLFLTIGTRSLHPYVQQARIRDKKIVARILPTASSMQCAVAVGLKPSEIIAVQGPLSLEMELAFIRNFNAQALVAKDSGSEGGTFEKCEAGRIANIPVVIVARPQISYPWQTSDVENLLSELRVISSTQRAKP